MAFETPPVETRLYYKTVTQSSRTPRTFNSALISAPQIRTFYKSISYRKSSMTCLSCSLSSYVSQTHHTFYKSISSGKSSMASSLVKTSHGSSGVQSTSAARTFSPPSERAPAASVSNAVRRPACHIISGKIGAFNLESAQKQDAHSYCLKRPPTNQRTQFGYKFFFFQVSNTSAVGLTNSRVDSRLGKLRHTFGRAFFHLGRYKNLLSTAPM